MVAVLLGAAARGSLAAPAVAAGATTAPSSETPLADTSNLDGWYVYLAPVGGLVRTEGAWDGVFGASATLLRVREERSLGTLGLSVGGARFTETSRGRLWADLIVGSRRLTAGRLMVGIGGGPMVEIDDLRHARFGGWGRIWCHLGVVPFVAFGVLERSGAFVAAGVEVSLPALRW